MTKRNQVISVSVTVAMSLVYFVSDRLFKRPRKLRHIPYISYFSIIKSLITKESYWTRADRVHLPLINKGTGLFLVCVIAFSNSKLCFIQELGVTGLELQVSNPADVKHVLL